MSRLFERINNIGLFGKIFIVMVVSIITVTISVTFSTLRMSEKLFTETFSITNAKVINQIKEDVEEYNDYVVITSNNIAKNGAIETFLTESATTSVEMMMSYYQMNEQMNRIRSILGAYDVGITVHGENGRNFSTNYIYWGMPENEFPNHSITKKTYNDPTRLMYHYDHPDNGNPAIIATKALVDRATGNIYGTMYITIEERKFRQFYANYTSDGNEVVLVDGAGLIVSSSRAEMIGKKDKKLLNHAKEIDERNLHYKNINYLDRKQIVLTEHLPSLDLYMINLIDQELVMHNVIDKKAILMISILIMGIALLLVFIISRRLTKSLTGLVRQIANISKYNFDHYVTVTGSYETKQLATTFNFMLDELHEYVEELIKTQKKQRNAELAALQQQINPHFLYNTLASVKIMIMQGEQDKAADMINKLISLLQNTLGNISETIPVEQELINMENYTFINQARYGEQIRVNYYVSPDCLTYQIPKLIIQPFIENAFFHGFKKKSTGFIRIMIGRQKDMLVCEVVDNGDGMEINDEKGLPNYKSKRQLFSGIGVKNVHERIQLLYGEAYGVEMSSEIGLGTKVKIRLPIIKDIKNPKT